MKNYKILGLDPGNILTGVVYLEIPVYTINPNISPIAKSKVLFSGHIPNSEVLDFISNNRFNNSYLETIEGRGNVVGSTIFETLFWTGRFYEALIRRVRASDQLPCRFYPKHIWSYIAGRPNASDKNIRDGLVRLYGEKFQFKNSHERAAMAVLGYGFDKFLNGD